MSPILKVVGELLSVASFCYGVYMLFIELGSPKITGHAVSVITLNPTTALFACLITVLSMAFFVFFKLK